jgi:hypothetical protein
VSNLSRKQQQRNAAARAAAARTRAGTPKPRAKSSSRWSLAMGAVAGVAIAVVVLGIYWTTNDSGDDAAVEQVAAGQSEVGASGSDSCIPKPQEQVAEVKVTAASSGALTVNVTAEVTVDGKPISGATPVLYADMADMPCSHTGQPVDLASVPGSPGTYRGDTQVLMPGTWRFVVQTGGDAGGSGETTASVSA